jgi:hypothetical protein
VTAPDACDELAAGMAEHRPDGGLDGPGAMCVTCTPGFGTPAEDPVPYPCVPLGRALLAARKDAERQARARASAELRAAAADIRRTTVLGHIAERLERRADALTADDPMRGSARLCEATTRRRCEHHHHGWSTRPTEEEVAAISAAGTLTTEDPVARS